MRFCLWLGDVWRHSGRGGLCKTVGSAQCLDLLADHHQGVRHLGHAAVDLVDMSREVAQHLAHAVQLLQCLGDESLGGVGVSVFGFGVSVFCGAVLLSVRTRTPLPRWR